ncbi:MAG: hypothetical protein CMD33_07380 [Flavobacteriales bacterium]|nr:hypothetical protein [Flavobacteriales bacterium]
MRLFNSEQCLWVAWGLLCVGASVLLAAYGRHGMASPELQMRWGIAVEYFRFMGLGLVLMVAVRTLSRGVAQRMWPERILVVGTLLFSGTVAAESIAPGSAFLNKLGWAAPLGGVLMALSWFTFVFEFIRNQRSLSS